MINRMRSVALKQLGRWLSRPRTFSVMGLHLGLQLLTECSINHRLYPDLLSWLCSVAPVLLRQFCFLLLCTSVDQWSIFACSHVSLNMMKVIYEWWSLIQVMKTFTRYVLSDSQSDASLMLGCSCCFSSFWISCFLYVDLCSLGVLWSSPRWWNRKILGHLLTWLEVDLYEKNDFLILTVMVMDPLLSADRK